MKTRISDQGLKNLICNIEIEDQYPSEDSVYDAVFDLRDARARIAALEVALQPFAHHDLCKPVGGVTRSEDIAYQKDKAQLRLGDFQKASKLLAKE